MSQKLPEVYLARHGETAWTVANRHTGRTDLPLTDRGERNAANLRGRLRGLAFTRVLVSPLQRRLADLRVGRLRRGRRGPPRPDRVGLRRVRGPGDRRGPRRAARLVPVPRRLPRGRVGRRRRRCADRVIAGLREAGGHTLLFGHGHFFRVLAACWIGLPPGDARHLLMNTASLSILTYEHTLDDPAVRLWNDDRHVVP